MPISIAQLVADPGLGLRLLAGQGGADRVITWAHTSELIDPTPWLEGGELLMTLALMLPHGDQDLTAYVARLSRAGVAGLAVDTGLVLQQVPPAIIAAGDAHNLPVLEVPAQTPFIAIAKCSRTLRMRARHRLHEPDAGVDRASDEEVVALVAACRSARDRLMVLLMARAGLRRGELCGLRRCDAHLLAGSLVLGCDVPRAHVHVRRRDNPNGAWAKSRRGRVVPLDSLVVQAFDGYAFERIAVPEAAASDFLFVNLFRAPLGGPMPPGAVNALVSAAGRRAGLRRRIAPHQLRHAFGSNVADAGGSLDEIAALLGHASVSSSQVYLHPDPGRLRDAVDRVPGPRGTVGVR